MRNATLGECLSVAVAACAGFFAGGFAGFVLFVLVYPHHRRAPDEPPFQWVEPMMWTALACAAVGLFVAFFAMRRIAALRRIRAGVGDVSK